METIAETTDVTQRVTEILEKRFPGAHVNAGRFYGAQKVSGQILWDGFEELDSVDRQGQVYDALDELGEDRRGVSIILAYTPREWNLMGDE